MTRFTDIHFFPIVLLLCRINGEPDHLFSGAIFSQRFLDSDCLNFKSFAFLADLMVTLLNIIIQHRYQSSRIFLYRILHNVKQCGFISSEDKLAKVSLKYFCMLPTDFARQWSKTQANAHPRLAPFVQSSPSFILVVGTGGRLNEGQQE